ncbi:hypothetical protein GCM10022243_29610 [Saccharothrix violaceirubra]|uniref:Mannose-6-phosphate isomerase-like protein (Cupin superfamily) n=1 Tax=Saccharothrix violaceirubra TaxID=413306 RepID=A0A7W7T7B6_9PSEU|nr:cupin [Saccharothrix violaceirubra]MBB4966585.1 mannose-6-phosphate isomerase-like protein (cupin superfamily) [Saccharothrix violaceirubra]
MHVVEETEDRTTRTAAATMTALAGPSRGSAELSTWRVRMSAGTESPPHVVDRDQVWMPVAGTFAFTTPDGSAEVTAGQAVVVAAGEERRFRTVDGPAEALVCMHPDGRAGVVGSGESHPLPWAG